MNPPFVGLDESWNAGLAMSAEHQLEFGTEIVFSYGPLGFLQGQTLWYENLAVVAFVYSAALYLTLCTSLIWALQRLLAPLPALIVAFLALVLLPAYEQPVVVTGLVCLGFLEARRPAAAVNGLVVVGSSFAAIEALLKLSTGPLVFAMVLIALVGLRARWWQLLAYLTLFAAQALLLWLLTGQTVGAIPDFLANTGQIVSGYSEAMLRRTDVAGWLQVGAILAAGAVGAALVAGTSQGRFADRGARRAAIALMAITGFVLFKQGAVRTDAGHLGLCFSTGCLLWLAIPWPRARRHHAIAGAAAIALLTIPVQPAGAPSHLDPVANLSNAVEGARNLLSPARRQRIISAGRLAMKRVYRLDAAALTELRGHSVAISPWEAGVAWAYRLEWSPLPVFQDYTAYTSKLDRLNTGEVQNPAGPDRILRENTLAVHPEFPTQAIDGRFPGWDPPGEARAILCHFAPLSTTRRWQVLGRVPPRCTPPELIRSIRTSYGTPVRVPAPGPREVVFARVTGTEVAGVERLGALLLRARARHAIVNRRQSYRLVPGTADDGLILRSSGCVAGTGVFSLAPEARTIELTGASGDLRFDFFRMSLRGGGRSAACPRHRASPGAPP